MPSITDKTPLESGCYFHIYNRGINREKLFYRHAHYLIFLRRYQQLLEEHVETYAYCLLPNHFHFLIRVNDSNMPGNEKMVSNKLNILFSKHALMINNQYNRYGSLFCKSFKRIKIKNDFYLRNLTTYIHHNPIKHKVSTDFATYQYSSYQGIINKDTKLINIAGLYTIFNSPEDFIKRHTEDNPFAILGKLKIEKTI